MRLVLASASPRRRELLAAAGFEFDVATANIDERRSADEMPRAYVERLARLKAATVAPQFPNHATIGADTIVVIDSEVLGKPADADEAARMLRKLSDRAHDVLTGVALAWGGKVLASVEQTRVWVSPLSDREIAWYVDSGEPLDKAGAYAIQGLASRFVTRIEGSYGTVVGLPVHAIVQLLRAAGLLPGKEPPESGGVASALHAPYPDG